MIKKKETGALVPLWTFFLSSFNFFFFVLLHYLLLILSLISFESFNYSQPPAAISGFKVREKLMRLHLFACPDFFSIFFFEVRTKIFFVRDVNLIENRKIFDFKNLL